MNCRALAPGVLNNDIFRFQTYQHLMKMTRTWDSTMSMIPKGGDTIWGGLDWSAEEGFTCSNRKQQINETVFTKHKEDGFHVYEEKRKLVNYGRIVSFGKDVAEAPLYEIERIGFKVLF